MESAKTVNRTTAAANAGLITPAAPAGHTGVCRPIHFRRAVFDMPDCTIKCAPLFLDARDETLRSELMSCPQFARLRLEPLLKNTRGGMRVIFFAESVFTATQAAVYLASMSQRRRALEPDETLAFDFFDDGPAVDEDGARTELLCRSLAVVTPAQLGADGNNGSVLRLHLLCAPAALIAAETGPVLGPAIVEQIASLSTRDDGAQMDVFIALRPGQADRETVNELCFTHGFQTAELGRPDGEYLRRYLRRCAEAHHAPIDPAADLDAVIAHTRRLRGRDFCEADLESLVRWVRQRHVRGPARTQDLIFNPPGSGRGGWKELERMVGLGEVKDALRRVLAGAAFEQRRRESGGGGYVRPAGRNLAFAGPPGTGKSVTARLVARIMREEGCGSGRFVEAGREQLIGRYLGHTSPKVAALFERARGGVLFIDEAGALLRDGGNDAFAVEAVNALVRHMELEPETMVIFATYAGEMERLLSSNPGLRSRVSRVISFPGYDDGQLWEIFRGFARAAEITLPRGAEGLCREHFHKLRRKDPGGFGNGRDARRLFEAAVEELALRALDTGAQLLSTADLSSASERLLAGGGAAAAARVIGF